MLQLASDPESIRFLRGNRISLPLLKNEIDRRMLKITCLVKRLDKRRRRSHEHGTRPQQEDKLVQTEIACLIRAAEDNQQEETALCPLNLHEKINRPPASDSKSRPKEDGRPAERAKASHLKSEGQRQQDRAEQATGASVQRWAGEEALIESNGFTFRQIEQTHEGSTARKVIQESQDDKIFQSLDFGLQISNVEMCNSITSEGDLLPARASLASRGARSDAQLVSAFADLSGSELGRDASRRHRKIRMAGREVVLPEPQRRIIVGQECRERMEREVEQLFGRKRKEVCDYKLRINVLKKIEEKYGEEYSA